jgi:hypothetical protein
MTTATNAEIVAFVKGYMTARLQSSKRDPRSLQMDAETAAVRAFPGITFDEVRDYMRAAA